MGVRDLVNEYRQRRDAEVAAMLRPDVVIGGPVEFDEEGTERPFGFANEPLNTEPLPEPPSFPQSDRAARVAAQQALRAKYEEAGRKNDADRAANRERANADAQARTRRSAMEDAARQQVHEQFANVGKPAAPPPPPPPSRRPMTDARRAAGLPLPEGLRPEEYSPDQRRTMTRNTFAPEVPMAFPENGVGGGTFSYNPDGTISMRAPSPQAMAEANAIPAEQRGGPEYIRALGRAYGIDVSQYGPEDEALLRNDVLRMHQIHQRQAAVSDVQDSAKQMAGNVPIVTGTNRYVVNPTKAANVQAARDASMSVEDRQRVANDILKRYSGFEGLTPAVQTAIASAVTTPNGFAQLRSINEQLRGEREAGSAAAAHSRTNNFNITRDINNPSLAAGMRLRSLLNDVRANNPLGMAVTYEAFGSPDAARDMLQLHAQGQQNAANIVAQSQQNKSDMEQARLAAQLQQDANLAIPDQVEKQVQAAMRNQNAAGRLQGMMQVIRSTPGNDKMDEKDVYRKALEQIASRVAAINPRDPAVGEYLKLLSKSGDRAAFDRFVTQSMNLPQAEADRMWINSGTALTYLPRAIIGAINGAISPSPGAGQASR